ncbi:DUF3667 domain-containing protein [Longimicrobium sp.]|uniref:DUF3667 domain-containing protein n=1 Tax=Longimicrobium sp. TaxID=2029185 RepID=UPI002E31F6BE|nr:DUF3667 domain-containing protein [Longimicrobium sp.]HEX6040061.1 DUF3667 domain-containing protein [Longimicrobium sp.]
MTDLFPPRPTLPPQPTPPLGTSEAPQPQPRRRWWQRAVVNSRKTPDRPCLNCGDETVGHFCPQCGQRKADVRVSLRRMLMEVMEDQLSVNSALPRTLWALVFRPGHLTREYVQGRIVRYIPPFRLYLVSSLLFFVVLPFIADPGELQREVEEGIRADSVREATAGPGAVRDSSIRAGGRNVGVRVQRGDNNNIDLNMGVKDTLKVPGPLRPLNRRLLAGEKRLNSLPPGEAIRTLTETFEENAPTGVFFMMPLFAFILKLLYSRRKRFYVEHFVFALHVHAFAFLMFTLMMVLRAGWLNAAMGAWFVIALYIAMKRVYGQGWFRTLLKFVILGWAYLFILMVGVMVTSVLTVLSV